MKYIRTKDGRIFPTKAKESDIDKSIYVGVADTIEELCDCFVYEGLGTTAVTDLEWVRNDPDIHNFFVYGAVETKKERIYVAKMNEEGELELL